MATNKDTDPPRDDPGASLNLIRICSRCGTSHSERWFGTFGIESTVYLCDRCATGPEQMLAMTQDVTLDDLTNRVNALVLDVIVMYIQDAQIALDTEDVPTPDAELLAVRAYEAAEGYGLAGVWEFVLPSVKARIASETAEWGGGEDDQ